MRQSDERNGALARPLGRFYCCFIVFICAVLHLKEKVPQKCCRSGMNHQGEADITKDSTKYTRWHMDMRSCGDGLNMRRLAKQTDCTWMTMRQKIGASGSRQQHKNEKRCCTRALKYAGRLWSWFWVHMDAAATLQTHLHIQFILPLPFYSPHSLIKRHIYIDRGQAEWASEVKGWISLHLLPQPLTICLSGSSLPLRRLNSKLAVAKQPLKEERFRWVNSNSYVLCNALWLSAYWKQERKKMRNNAKLGGCKPRPLTNRDEKRGEVSANWLAHGEWWKLRDKLEGKMRNT